MVKGSLASSSAEGRSASLASWGSHSLVCALHISLASASCPVSVSLLCIFPWQGILVLLSWSRPSPYGKVGLTTGKP